MADIHVINNIHTHIYTLVPFSSSVNNLVIVATHSPLAFFFEFLIVSITETGRFFPDVLSKLNSPSVVKPALEKR